MKKAKAPKLTLHRETLRSLEEPLLDVLGAVGTNQRTVCGSCATCIVFQTHCLP